ncbi:MAG TPA: hypothetical protein DCZ11_03255 [Gammaproteobacteria bacterium]|nr:hypothetical protein [Gammaproteobacteria bacterium]MCH77444.1 hypothetical protein [Gammaproteobacteria bacterium]
MTLTPAELAALTGYRRPSKQIRWLREQLRVSPAVRPDGTPAVTWEAINAAMAPKPVASSAPRWSKVAA